MADLRQEQEKARKIAIDFTQIQNRIADKLRSEVADKATVAGSDVGQPSADGAQRFEAHLRGSDSAGMGQPPAASHAPSDAFPPQSPPTAASSPSDTQLNGSASLGDRILANMAPQSATVQSTQGFNPVEAVQSPSQVVTDPSQALDWQLQGIELKEEVGLSTRSSQGSDQDIDALLKAQ